MDLIRERLLMSNRKGSDNVKEWTKILEFTIDETEMMPSNIDISEYILPVCTNNSGAYDIQNTSIMSPYTRRINPVLSPLKFSINQSMYAIITGTIVIYAR